MMTARRSVSRARRSRSPGLFVSLVAAIGVLSGVPIAAEAFMLERIAIGVARPVFLTAPPGDRERVFIVEQHTGQIRILRLIGYQLVATPFLTVGGLSTGDEQGLLGLAFDPDYASNGYFYVYYTNPHTRVVRYQVSNADPDLAD
jgi:hypothetical protein